jgi:transcriptional regulator with XRE-family HTH domain
MGNADFDFDRRIAESLKRLRSERGLSLDELSRLSGVSRASLSRLENADVSPTTGVLGKLCPVYGLTMSRLMALAESDFAPLLRRADQACWYDAATGFRRRSVSPPSNLLAGEVVECELDPGTDILYDDTPRPGLEHHLVMLSGALAITVDGVTTELLAGDCFRYRLEGASRFRAGDEPAHYLLFIL